MSNLEMREKIVNRNAPIEFEVSKSVDVEKIK